MTLITRGNWVGFARGQGNRGAVPDYAGGDPSLEESPADLG